jgi:aryl-alcohol dehydrogenase-like predicted oxidoreductase
MADFCSATSMRLLPFGCVAGGFLSEKYIDTPANQYVPVMYCYVSIAPSDSSVSSSTNQTMSSYVCRSRLEVSTVIPSRLRRLVIDTYSKSKYASVITQNGGWAWFQTLLRALQGISIKHGTSIANVACRWVLDKPHVAGIIVGARNANHVQDHVNMFALKLDADDQILRTGRQAQGDIYDWERGGKW